MASTVEYSKIVELAGIRRPMQSGYDEKPKESVEQRREFRRESNERLFVQVVKCTEPGLIGTTLTCRAADVSANGLKILADTFLPVGTVLDLWVDDSRRPGKFFLSSDVRWVSENSDGSYQVGVQLHNGTATDIASWRERNG